MQGHTRKTVKTNQKQCSTPSHMVVVIYYYIGYKYKATTWYLNGFPNGYYDKIYLQLINMGGLRLQRAIGTDIK